MSSRPPHPSSHNGSATGMSTNMSTIPKNDDDDNIEDDGSGSSGSGHVDYSSFKVARPSLALHMIRHAESANNEVYRNAKIMFRGGTADFDGDSCRKYVEAHRRADPDLSPRGNRQADALAEYLVPHLQNQASRPVRVVCSPMLRTLLTIKPTLERLHREDAERGTSNDAHLRPGYVDDDDDGLGPAHTIKGGMEKGMGRATKRVHIVVVALYFETEGCHLRGVPEPGLTPNQIRHLLAGCVDSVDDDIEFVGFDDGPDVGWYARGTGPEKRAESELRAAKYCLWLSEYIDRQLYHEPDPDDLFDAGVVVEGEDQEDEHDKHEVRIRRRRTTLAIGHGDFMSTVLKRLVTGFGHTVESEGVPHRSAFAHFNTGITELECFGNGRFLVMATNQTPHIPPHRYRELRSGGTLRDGWSFLVPPVLDAQVEVVFSDSQLDNHVREQTAALKALYMSSGGPLLPQPVRKVVKSTTSEHNNDWDVEEEQEPGNHQTHFIVKRGLQVVGVATYSEDTGLLTDVAIRPSAVAANRGNSSGHEDGEEGLDCAETLIRAVKTHARKMGRSDSLIVQARSQESLALFARLGFSELDGDLDVEGGAPDPDRQVLSSML